MEADLWKKLEQEGAEEVATVLETLPPGLEQELRPVPITFEPRPNAGLVASGLDRECTLGLFTGVPFPQAIAVSQHLPPQIILFLENIWNYAGHDIPRFRLQLRKTLLHEIGHYLGLDERAVALRGLR